VTSDIVYPGEPLEGEDPNTADLAQAIRWTGEYARRIEEEAKALNLVLAELNGGLQDEPELLDQQEGHLRTAEVLLARARYWNDREAALRRKR